MRIERRKRVVPREGEKKDQQEKVDLSGMSLDSLMLDSSLNLALITKLDLSNNNLESIPESITARLLNVEVLDVHSNRLMALPNSIGCLFMLKVLNVSSNLLESLPGTIENCKALEELNANFNQLTRLPDTMGFELTALRVLAVNSNKLSFLPSSTSHMTSLVSLDARLNHLRSLPSGLENLIRLRSLDVSQNFHHLCSLPYAIGLLLSLSHLDVSYNALSVLPDSLACLAKLHTLNAAGNPLVRPPPEIVALGVHAVRDYLRPGMNGAAKKGRRGPSWIGRIVKCGTFNGRTIPRDESDESFEEHGMTLRHSHSGVFSPWRIFSPRRSAPSSPMK